MNKFQQFKQLMNMKMRKYTDAELKTMWQDWYCEHDIFKKTLSELGFNQNDRVKLVSTMNKLGIPECINLSGINVRVYPEFYSEETAHLFATMQNQIATKREYRHYEGR